MSEVQLDSTSAMRQAGMTADDYLGMAKNILKNHDDDVFDWTLKEAVELAKVISKDFHTTMMCLKMQEIRDAINDLDRSSL